MLFCCAAHALDPFARWACEPVAKADGETAPLDRRTEIERLADKIAPSIGKAVRDALEEHADRVPMDQLEDAIRDADTPRILAMIGELDRAKAQAVTDALQDAVWAGAAFEGGKPAFRGVTFAFNRLNPQLTRWLEGYSLNLIREVNADTTASVRAALLDGMNTGKNPIDQARAVRQSISLTERQSKAVQNYRRELETMHLKRSAKAWGLGAEIDRKHGTQVFRPGEGGKPKDGIEARRLRDFRYDGATQRALETGKALKPAQIDKMVAAYARKYLRHRSETIARTEAIRALAAGKFETWRQAIASGAIDGALVRKTWRVSGQERMCPTCKAIPGMNPKRGVPWDKPFATPIGPIMLPTAHPNCMCDVLFRLYEASQLEGV